MKNPGLAAACGADDVGVWRGSRGGLGGACRGARFGLPRASLRGGSCQCASQSCWGFRARRPMGSHRLGGGICGQGGGMEGRDGGNRGEGCCPGDGGGGREVAGTGSQPDPRASAKSVAE